VLSREATIVVWMRCEEERMTVVWEDPGSKLTVVFISHDHHRDTAHPTAVPCTLRGTVNEYQLSGLVMIINGNGNDGYGWKPPTGGLTVQVGWLCQRVRGLCPRSAFIKCTLWTLAMASPCTINIVLGILLLLGRSIDRSVSLSLHTECCGRSLCVSLCHVCELCKNLWTDRDALWELRRVDLGSLKKPCVGWGLRSPWGRGNFQFYIGYLLTIVLAINLACLALYTSEPSYLSELISPYVPARTLRSSNTYLLAIPTGVKSHFSSRSFYVYAPSTCNSLPKHIRYWQTINVQASTKVTVLPVGISRHTALIARKHSRDHAHWTVIGPDPRQRN